MVRIDPLETASVVGTYSHDLLVPPEWPDVAGSHLMAHLPHRCTLIGKICPCQRLTTSLSASNLSPPLTIIFVHKPNTRHLEVTNQRP